MERKRTVKDQEKMEDKEFVSFWRERMGELVRTII